MRVYVSSRINASAKHSYLLINSCVWHSKCLSHAFRICAPFSKGSWRAMERTMSAFALGNGIFILVHNSKVHAALWIFQIFQVFGLAVGVGVGPLTCWLLWQPWWHAQPLYRVAMPKLLNIAVHCLTNAFANNQRNTRTHTRERCLVNQSVQSFNHVLSAWLLCLVNDEAASVRCDFANSVGVNWAWDMLHMPHALQFTSACDIIGRQQAEPVEWDG